MNKCKLWISVALLTALMGFSTACSRKPNDDAMAKDIQSKIATDPDTQGSQITAAVKDGKVTLTGTAQTPAAQTRAELISKAEPGQTGIDDQITVPSDQSAMAQQPAAQPMQQPAPEPAPAPAPPPPPKPIVVPAGTAITVSLGQALSSKTSQTGQTFMATVAQPITVGGRSAIPSGASVSGTVVAAKSQGKIKGEGELDLTLLAITVKGQTYQIQTSTFDSTSKGKGKRTAVATGGGAAGGALIGGLAGGGKGAGIGALVGAGAGLVGGAMTGNKQVEMPAETAVTFTLSAPLTLPPPSR